MAKKILPTYARLIQEMSNGDDCRPDWATYVKEQFAQEDSHAKPAEARQAPGRRSHLRLVWSAP